MSELPPAPSPRPRRTRWILLGVVAAIWAGAAGAVIVATRRDDAAAAGSFTPSTHAGLTQLRYVIGDLPEGYSSRMAVSAESAVPPSTEDVPLSAPSAAYATPDDPSAPRLWVFAGDEALEPGFVYLDQTTGVVESQFDGRRAACGNFEALADLDVGPEQVWCYVDAEPEMVMLRSEGLDIEDTVAMLQGLQFEGDSPRLDPAVLPEGMQLIDAYGAAGPDQYATSLVRYSGPCTSNLSLVIAWDDEMDLATARLGSREWTIVDIAGEPGYFSAAGTLVWEADGRAFQLTAMSDGEVDLVAIARSVRAASPEEWAALSVQQPAPTLPALSPSAVADTVDALQATEEIGNSGGTVQMQSALGDSGVATVAWDDDRAIVTTANGEEIWACAVPMEVRIVPIDSEIVDGELRAHGAMATVIGHGPRYLDVTSTDGTVVRTELVHVPGSTDAHIALVELPDGLVAAAQVTDTLGKVMRTL